jgi:transposase
VSPRKRPTAVVQHRYHWCYLYAFVHPSSGCTLWLLRPTVSMAAFTVALSEFAQAVGAGQGKQVLSVLDGAGWHVSPQLPVPEGVHLHHLSPYSPEIQPAERVWPLTNEPLAHRHCRHLDALQEVQAHRCLRLQARPEVIRAHTNFHYILPYIWKLYRCSSLQATMLWRMAWSGASVVSLRTERRHQIRGVVA